MGYKMVKPVAAEHDRNYRYQLHRYVGPDKRLLCWVMLNPSTADDEKDDMTIRKVKGFTYLAGYGRLVVVNLFAKRSTDPKLLFTGDDPTGPLNGETLLRIIGHSDLVVAAWGSFYDSVPLTRRVPRPNVEAMANYHDVPMVCLGLTQGGHPRHPLYVSYKQPFEAFTGGLS